MFPTHSPRRILVAEDDSEMRRLVVETLRGEGYAVTEATDGGRLLVELARNIVRGEGSEALDLIVSDVRMPVCTGLQILEQLRLSEWRTPVILMTAFGDSATRQRARELDALLIDKPFLMNDMRLVVARLFRAAPSDRR
jgi:CheY-like chemotaxis protein